MPVVLISGGASCAPQNLLTKRDSQKVNSPWRGETKEHVCFIWSCFSLAAFKTFQGIFFLSFFFFLLPNYLLYLGIPIWPPAFSRVSLMLCQKLNECEDTKGQWDSLPEARSHLHAFREAPSHISCQFVPKALVGGPPPSSLTQGRWGRGYP